jgi:elongation of very long chain fatty acids protein 4
MYQSEANIFCATLHSPNKEGEMRVINALWIYFLSKAVEFFDTFFMVIRKKFNQITFLHCYHHSTMVSEIYFILKI